MKKLIINADDFGLSPGVTRGIIDAHIKGIVTSTSAMMNAPGIENSLDLIRRDASDLGMGVHLVLTWGEPRLSPGALPGLVDDFGHFYNYNALSGNVRTINLNAVHNEWRAQIEAFFATGRKPDHLDSHHHCSYLSPGLFSVMLDLASAYNLPIRYPPLPSSDFPLNLEMMGRLSIKSPQACNTDFYGSSVSLENLAGIFSVLPEGISELMCHPGYADRVLLAGSSYAADREKELKVLTDPRARSSVLHNGISLIRFSDL